MTPQFKTEEVSKLWQKYQSLSHSEFPFLDKSYSPSSLVPCCDFTLDIAQLILDGKFEAVWELLEFLGAEKKAFLMAHIPDELSIDSFGMAEIIATFLLTWRMPCASCQSVSIGTEVLASVLASHGNSLTADGCSRLKDLSANQLQLQRQAECDFELLSDEDDDNELCDFSENVNKDYTEFFALSDSDGDIVTADMRGAPPMVRIALARFFLSESYYWNSKVRFEHGSGYGCSAEVGNQCLAAMSFLESVSPSEGKLPREITKENLYEELKATGYAPAKSSSRQKLVELAIADEPLLRKLLRKYAPGLVCVKPQFKIEAEKWFRRYSLAKTLARGVFADMTSCAFSKEFNVPLAAVEKERAETIMDTAKSLFRGRAHYDSGKTRGGLAAFPAQELIRVCDSKTPRNWTERWNSAGGKTCGGRMVALKDDPIWTRISRFGIPWPPFDFGSGMGIRDIDYDEAVKLGLTP